DAAMDVSIPANRVVEVTGCASVQGEQLWQFDSLIATQVTANEAGEYVVTIKPAFAKSPAEILLDGNQNPARHAGIVPNRDDHVARGRCVTAPEPTPTSGLDPRTATPTDPTGVAGPTVEVIVLLIDGEHFPAEQFIGAPADACDAAHYHARQPVASLEGTVITADPNPNGCGFGKVADVPTVTLQVPEATFEEWKKATGR